MDSLDDQFYYYIGFDFPGDELDNHIAASGMHDVWRACLSPINVYCENRARLWISHQLAYLSIRDDFDLETLVY